MNKPLRNSTAEWKALEEKHHLAPFTDYKGLKDEGGARIIVKAEGVRLFDSEGGSVIDGMSGLWCVNVGYSQKRLADVAYRQMLELPYYNTFFKTAHPPVAELSAKLAQLTPKGLNHVFYGSSGSEANDTIVRMVRRFWNIMGKPEKKVFIGRQYGYHGSTMAAASLGGFSAMHQMSDLPLPGFVHVMPPYQYQFGNPGESELDFGKRAAKAVEDKILELGADKIAAFIGEPIMGAGGVVVPPKNYWAEVQKICKKHDVLVIADEVICGFGRTGNWFGSQTLEIEPDLMTMAKGLTSGYLPLSGVMVGDRVAKAMIDKGGEFYHGYTYDGHPVSCAVALANIAIIEELGLIDQVKNDTGPYFQKAMRDVFGKHPAVDEVRGIGLIGAMEIKPAGAKRGDGSGKRGVAVRDRIIANGLIMRACWDTMVYAPPLTITRSEIDQFVEAAKKGVDEAAKQLGLK